MPHFSTEIELIKTRAAMTDRLNETDKEMADDLYQFPVMNIRFAITSEIPRFSPSRDTQKKKIE